MGDTKRFTNKYNTPNHPWKRDRIDLERPLRRTYGLKNGREAWKVATKLKGFKDQIKGFAVMQPKQMEVEREQLSQRLAKYGFLPEDGNLEGVLGYTTEKLLERRLQTVLVRRQLAHTMKQARQFITHRHILVNGRVVTAPGYLVPLSEESSIVFKVNSSLSDEQHPERLSKEDAAAKRSAEKEAKRALAERNAAAETEVIEVAEDDNE